MKAEELRIGNFIELYKKPDGSPYISRVTGFTNTGRIWFVIQPICPDCAWDIMSLAPIIITEEWLLKFGFEKDENSTRWSHPINAEGKPPIFYYTDCYLDEKARGSFIFPGWKMMPVRYVHQLQNLYFALTGEELI